MTKSTLISITLVAATVVVAIGYQSLTSEPESVEATPQQGVTSSQIAHQVQTSSKPVAPVSISASQHELEQLELDRSESEKQVLSGTQRPTSNLDIMVETTPSLDNEPTHPPRQATNSIDYSGANRAPTSAPSAGENYAHHPRPGTAQPISAPVSKPSQQPVN